MGKQVRRLGQEEAALGRTLAASNPQRPCCRKCHLLIDYLLIDCITLKVQFTDTVSHLHNIIQPISIFQTSKRGSEGLSDLFNNPIRMQPSGHTPQGDLHLHR